MRNMFHWIIIPILAICGTVGGFFLAVLVAGPIARALVGVPVGFREHFTSSEAFRQALLVQTVTLGFMFIVLGIALGRKVRNNRFILALWAANPVIVGVGFVLYKRTYDSLPMLHYLEYEHVKNAAILAVLAPVVLSLCFFIGAQLIAGWDGRREKNL